MTGIAFADGSVAVVVVSWVDDSVDKAAAGASAAARTMPLPPGAATEMDARWMMKGWCVGRLP